MLDKPPARTLVLGVGNTLMCDEGVGVHVVERLAAKYRYPEQVQILDGGTLGMDLLYYLEGVENLLIVDAVQADKAPGELVRLQDDEVPAFLGLKISPHQIGVPDMLFAAKLKDMYPPSVVLWGVQPERVEIGLELSETVAEKVDVLVERIVEELRRWGYEGEMAGE
ncbi:MAG TPA: HyaD/HybD family hydrogenase maturation endopeptidase [Anaerolineales bacterium]|nr:HyaD/HybD family hydrogenase maturation endopeptidase [Anaerolineales bacterium]